MCFWNNSSINDDKLIVYPNPSNGLFTIQNAKNIESVTITDISGKVVLNKQFADNQSVIDISYLENGIYFLQISIEKISKTYRIILNK